MTGRSQGGLLSSCMGKDGQTDPSCTRRAMPPRLPQPQTLPIITTWSALPNFFTPSVNPPCPGPLPRSSCCAMPPKASRFS